MGKLFCCGGGGGGVVWVGEEEGEGGGEGGANLHFLFLHQGRVFLTVYWVGEGREGLIFTSYFYTRGEFSLLYIGWGGGLPFFPETFVFIGIVLLNRDLNLGGN